MNKQRPRLMVMGHARHGKDTVCEILRDEYGFTFASSSQAALNHVIWPIMQSYYSSKAECFNDRQNWRALWFELIKRFNHDDPTALAREIYFSSEIYCGIRSRQEFDAISKAKLFDYSVWVDARDRVPSECKSSIQVDESLADLLINNNGTREQLTDEVKTIAEGWLV